MSTHVGSHTVVRTTLPNNAALNRIQSVKLSREAKLRLRIIEHYLNVTKNVAKTCRHFAITRSYFYKWYSRYHPGRLGSLENRSRRPKKVRQATYDIGFVALIRRLRTDFPCFSAKKLARIVLRDYDVRYSAATIGRIIQKFQLYFSKTVRVARYRKAAKKALVLRKTHELQAAGPRTLIEFDMKHIRRIQDRKRYAFVAVDVVTKQAVIHVATSPSSLQAKKALEKTVAAFGTGITILNDNGSENFLHAYDYLKEQEIPQYFARPHTPKDKPHVENLIGKLQQECLAEDNTNHTVPTLQAQINHWLNDYHFFRPHQALDYMTPSEYCATFGLSIPRAELSTM